MEIIDAHCHFLSYNYFRLLTRQRPDYKDVDAFIIERSQACGFTVPPTDPVRLADHWVIELDRYNVSRAVVISSIPGDGSSIAEAVRVYPDRFIGMATVNPFLAVSEELIEHKAREWGFRGIILYPSMHRFSASSERLYPIYRLARRYHLAVYIHFGHLRIPPRKWWNLPDLYDPHYCDPHDLHQVAADFPSVNFVVPSFGAGMLHSLLRLAVQCPNIYLDTSSSNSWILDQSEFDSLREVFERSLEVFGPARIIFGTDSGTFPRGWRRDIYQQQLDILNSIGLSSRAIEAIMAQNARHVFGLDRDIPTYMV